jgi:Rps23 Pro-64 3,4-dihydroxylase Tpa1-like proline 4-hydroxylase
MALGATVPSRVSALKQAPVVGEPFAHVRLDDWFGDALNDAALSWLETDAPWRLRIASFYEQYEFSLLADRPPAAAVALTSIETVADIASLFADRFQVPNLALVDITAHRLVAGQTIRLHNDYIGDAETHRMLVQLNRGWDVSNGGLLMLFGSQRAEDVCAAIIPRHGSAFAFAISPQSFHAVSTIVSGDRFTLVYTFRKI